jgi:N-acetylmuramoyl-L-alanine amidase
MAVPTPHTSRPNSNAHTGRILQTTFSVAILLATLFTAFSPKMFSSGWGAIFGSALTPQPGDGAAVPTSQKAEIGIVSGHWNDSGDPGAVCPDGVSEQAVNLAVARLVRQKLEARGYQIDLLQEFDPRLDNYHAAMLLSIHADTCDYIDEQATGFKIAASTYSRDRNLANRLTACLYDRYAATTGLHYHPGSITVNMTDYYAFRAIDPTTTAAIIETGFLNLDRDLLVNHPDKVADGIVAGVICFVTNQSVQPTPITGP